MQSPTLTNVKLRSIHDALKIFHAVAQGRLPMIMRRLDFDERREIKSGNIYVWEERNSSNSTVGLGIERWTDGRQYTPSRVRDEFLLYVAKDSDSFPPGADSSDAAQIEANRLIKQTYSIYLANSNPRKKWHITAYYTPAALRGLATVDNVPALLSLTVPEGLYFPARIAKHQARPGRGNDDTSGVSSYSPPHSTNPGHPTRRRASITSETGDACNQLAYTNPPYYAPYNPRAPRGDAPEVGGSHPRNYNLNPSSSGQQHIPFGAPPAPRSMVPARPMTPGRLRAPGRPLSPVIPPVPSHFPPSLSSQLPSMVPLSLLQQTQNWSPTRDTEDNNMLRRFPPSGQ